MAKKQMMTIKQQDGSVWAVPVEIIARNRATHYASEYGGDVEKSLAEDTLPMFKDSSYEITDWASNQMDWSDFDGHQVKISDAPPLDFQEAWVNGEKDIVEIEVDAHG